MRGRESEGRVLSEVRGVTARRIAARRGRLTSGVFFADGVAAGHVKSVGRRAGDIRIHCCTSLTGCGTVLRDCVLEYLRLHDVEFGDYITDSGTVIRIADEDELKELYQRRDIANLGFLLFRQEFLTEGCHTNEESYPIIIVE